MDRPKAQNTGTNTLAKSRDTPPGGGIGGGDEGGATALRAYRDKRSGDRTGEPMGAEVPSGSGDDLASDLGVGLGIGGRPGAITRAQPVGVPKLFVVQMHAARRLHWDLRLEIGGVLRSWAVPRGPSLDPADKRLAVQTEDHPIEYVEFEGVIPKGNYGAGEMIVWDRGVWVALEDLAAGYRDGKLLFELRGHKLRGVWTLVRTKGEDGRMWLLMKKPDGASSTAGIATPDDASILSGLTVEDLRRGADRAGEVRERLEALGALRQRVDVAAAGHMLAETKQRPFDRKGWVFELKYDGYRLFASRAGDRIRLKYRSGRDATDAFPEITRTVRALPYSEFIIDGEVVVLDDDARPNFQRLQKRAMLLRERDIDRAKREHPVTLYAFDLIAFEDFDLRKLPLSERKALLKMLLPTTGSIRYADHIPERGKALFGEVRRLGVEGIMAKKANAPYVAGRTASWVKVRIERTDDFVIVGFSEPEGTRVGFRALHLASHRGGELLYVGRVGTGFTDTQLLAIRELLEPLRRKKPVAKGTPTAGRGHVWLEPELVAEIKYKELTDGQLLRHPSFIRLRDDKHPRECQFGHDEPDPGEEDVAADEPPTAGPGRTVTISNPDKVFWPVEGYTKLDLIRFYQSISKWLLPYLEDRPLVLTRYPDGIEGKSFFQKNAPPYIPDWIKTKTMWSEHAGREIEYFVCNDIDALTYIANMASIPLHVWGSRLADLQHPDWTILDLDPKGAPFSNVVRIAREIHDLCDDIGLPNVVKTSGSTGLHVLVPLGGQCTFAQARQLGGVIAQIIAQRLPDIATIARAMRARKGRVYIDFIQNGHGRLLVSPFSVRPLPGAPVSTPLRWEEVTETLDHRVWTIDTVPKRMRQMGTDPFVEVLEHKPDLQAALERLAKWLE